EGLPEDEREVFDLVRIQGLTHAEAATVVGVSEKTVQRRLNRARLLLAERLADLRPAMSCKPTPPGGMRPPCGGTAYGQRPPGARTARGDARIGQDTGGGVPRFPRPAPRSPAAVAAIPAHRRTGQVVASGP